MTEPLHLAVSSGNAQIDAITAGVIRLAETQFPGRIAGYYFQGSCADQAVTALSDIDLCLVFHTPLTPAEQTTLLQFRSGLKYISPRPLDITSSDVVTLWQADTLRFQPEYRPVFAAVTLKSASTCVFGADIRTQIPAVRHDVATRTYMHFPYIVLAAMRQYPARLPYPLSFLDPGDPFFGYTGRHVQIAHGVTVPSTKRIVHASGFIATALLAWHSAIIVGDKRTAVTAYRRHINDTWADHLDAVHSYCRVQWDYQVPEAAADQAILRDICRRELAFENQFLAVYHDYLRRDQSADDPIARQVATERLQRIAYDSESDS